MENTPRSILAVLAGFITVFVLSVVTDAVLHAAHVYPEGPLFNTWLLLLAFGYRSVFTVLGGYVTAKLAPQKPVKHAIILGVVGTIAGAAGTIAGWDLSSHWYPIALTVTAIPFTWLGAKLYERRH
jgi:hypothetical protein